MSEVLLENPQLLSVSDRASLINDAFNLAKGGRLPFSTALQVQRMSEIQMLAPRRGALFSYSTVISNHYIFVHIIVIVME